VAEIYFSFDRIASYCSNSYRNTLDIPLWHEYRGRSYKLHIINIAINIFFWTHSSNHNKSLGRNFSLESNFHPIHIILVVMLIIYLVHVNIADPYSYYRSVLRKITLSCNLIWLKARKKGFFSRINQLFTGRNILLK